MTVYFLPKLYIQCKLARRLCPLMVLRDTGLDDHIPVVIRPVKTRAGGTHVGRCVLQSRSKTYHSAQPNGQNQS